MLLKPCLRRPCTCHNSLSHSVGYRRLGRVGLKQGRGNRKVWAEIGQGFQEACRRVFFAHFRSKIVEVSVTVSPSKTVWDAVFNLHQFLSSIQGGVEILPVLHATEIGISSGLMRHLDTVLNIFSKKFTSVTRPDVENRF